MDRIVVRSRAFEFGDSAVEAWPRLGELDLPVTLATGDLDAGYLQVRTAQLLGRIPGAARADLPGTAHLPSLDRPELITELVSDLVSGLRRRGAS
jgi:pimeloyl-ACP methyl ester carboxylesterase